MSELKIEDCEVHMVEPGTERPWPHLGEEYEVVIAVGIYKTAVLVQAPPQVREVASDNCADNIEEIPIIGLDADEGIYRCKVKFFFHQGYFEGYPAPGESDWGFEVVENSIVEVKLA